MKPDDANGNLPAEQRPFRVLLLAGSDRRQYDCPGIDSKARALMLRMADRLPAEWEIDFEDLGNVWNREQIRACNGCVSTSMALCVWPCNCYEKDSEGMPDLMWMCSAKTSSNSIIGWCRRLDVFVRCCGNVDSFSHS